MSDTRVTFTLNKVVAVLNGRADAILRSKFDMTYSQFLFLLRVGDDTCSQSEVAAMLDVSAAAVSKRVQWFVERGLITASTDSVNARRVLLSLTTKGRRQVDRAAEVLESAFVNMFAGMESVNLTKLNSQLNIVLNHLENAPR